MSIVILKGNKIYSDTRVTNMTDYTPEELRRMSYEIYQITPGTPEAAQLEEDLQTFFGSSFLIEGTCRMSFDNGKFFANINPNLTVEGNRVKYICFAGNAGMIPYIEKIANEAIDTDVFYDKLVFETRKAMGFTGVDGAISIMMVTNTHVSVLHFFNCSDYKIKTYEIDEDVSYVIGSGIIGNISNDEIYECIENQDIDQITCFDKDPLAMMKVAFESDPYCGGDIIVQIVE